MAYEVLYSPGYGAGWSSWCPRIPAKFMTMDPTLIEMAKRKASAEEVETYIQTKFPNGYVYMGGWENIKVGTVSGPFRIEEYDGYESIEELGDIDFVDPR